MSAPEVPPPYCVAVFGATGDQGKSVVRALTSAGCFRIRALVADIDMKDVVRLQAEFPLLEVLQAGQEKKEEMEDALQGCYAAFISTDSSSAGEREYEYGCNSVEAAKAAGVQHCIWNTVPNVAALSGKKYQVPIFTNKAKVDKTVRKAGFPYYTFVMCSFFFQEFSAPSSALTSVDEHGTVTFTLPLQPHHMMTGMDAEDTGLAVLNAIQNSPYWTGKYMCLAGYHGPIQRYCDIFFATTGRKAVYKVAKEGLTEEWEEMFRWFAEYTYYGNFDLTNGRKANPYMKDWADWLLVCDWVKKLPLVCSPVSSAKISHDK